MIKFFRSVFISTLFFFFVNGCISYSLITPLYPEVGNPNKSPDQVENLQPTLKWEPSKYSDVTYDLIIFDGVLEESFWEGTKRSIGDTVYYKENIKETSYKIETKLKPDTEYYWSVRIRRSNGISDWSTYDYEVFLVFSYIRVYDSLFRFATPKGVKN